MTKLYRDISRILHRSVRLKICWLIAGFSFLALLEILAMALVAKFVSNVTLQQLPGPFQNLNFINGFSQEVATLALALFIFAIFLFKGLLASVLIFSQGALIARAKSDSVIRGSTSFLRRPLTFHLERGSAELLRIVRDEVVHTFECVLLPMIIIICETFVIVVVIAFLLWVEPLATLAAVMILLGTIWLYRRHLQSRLEAYGKKNQSLSAKTMNLLAYTFSSVGEIKALNKESFFLEKLREYSRESEAIWKIFKYLNEVPRLLMEICAILVLLTISIVIYIQPQKRETLITFLALFTMGTFRLLPSMNRVMSSLHFIAFFRSSLSLLAREMPDQCDVMQPPSSPDSLPRFSALTLRHVTYRHPNSVIPTLNDISLTITRGQRVAIVGPSGSGKTTLIYALLGLIQPSEGTVLVNGDPLFENLDRWRSQVGFVPQRVTTFDGTIAENIALAERIDETLLHKALEISTLDSLVEQLPDGVNCRLGAGGTELSGGEQQRLGIARALYRNPEVMIFDEPTSSLDSHREALVLEKIFLLSREKTIIFVTHNLAAAQLADWTFKLESDLDCERGKGSL